MVTYVVIPTFITCAISNVHFINSGLKDCDGLVFIPIYYVLVTLASTVVVGGSQVARLLSLMLPCSPLPLQGTLFFREAATFGNALDASMFILGVCITLVGVAVLSTKEAQAGQLEGIKGQPAETGAPRSPIPHTPGDVTTAESLTAI